MTSRVGSAQYDAVLFDMDGVLLQGAATPAHVYANAADDAIDDLGMDIPEEERESLRSYNYDDALKATCQRYDVDPATFWERREHFASVRANERLGNRVRAPYPDTDVLANLPIKRAIVSNNRHATVKFVAEELFDGVFDTAIGRDPTPAGFANRKPEPEYLERGLAALDVEDALYVGDREKDLIAARRAGIDGAFIRREHNSRMSFDRPPAVDVESLRELEALL